MDTEALTDTVRELTTKPGHEKVRALVHKLLTDALGARSEQITYEHRMPEVRGRADALVGRTIIEVKRDLAVENTDAETQLARYLPQRETETGQRYIGLSTDGSVFGSDRFRLAVSADGSTFFDGLSVDNTTGIVDQPRLPRFKAYTNYDNYVGVGTWTKIGLNNTDTNDQGAFDAGTNLFTAPVNGTYLFGATLL